MKRRYVLRMSAFFAVGSFLFAYPVFSKNPLGLMDDLADYEKVHRLLSRWKPEYFRSLFDEQGRLTRPIRVKDLQEGLDIQDISVLESLFRKSLWDIFRRENYMERQVLTLRTSEAFKRMLPKELQLFEESLEQCRRIRESIEQDMKSSGTPRLRLQPVVSMDPSMTLNRAFRRLVTEQCYQSLKSQTSHKEILDQLLAKRGQRLSSVLSDSEIFHRGERHLTAIEKKALSQALRTQHGKLFEKLQHLKVQRNRWQLRNPQGKILQGQLERLNIKISSVEAEMKSILEKMYYLESTRSIPKVRFVGAFHNERRALVGGLPPIEQEFVIGSAQISRKFGEYWVGLCDVTAKSARALPEQGSIKAIAIFGSSVVTVLAFSVLVPPSKSVVGDFLTMMAFKALWWKYKNIVDENKNFGDIHKNGLNHDLSAPCPICHPVDSEDFTQTWKDHGMRELLQIDNPKLNGNLNTFLISLFYANSSILTEPMIRGRDIFLGLQKNVLELKMTYAVQETLQHVILLRLGKYAETYEEKKMLLQDYNASILSNYWIVEFAFFLPILNPNLGTVVNKFLYHTLFQHYLHRQPEMIQERFKTISDFLIQLKQEEEKVVQKARAYGFMVDEIGIADVGSVAPTQKKPLYLIDSLKYPLIGQFLQEQDGTLTDPFSALDIMPRLESIRPDVEREFMQKRIHLPEIQLDAHNFLIETSQDSQTLKKREEIETMIENVKEMQRNFIDNLLVNGLTEMSRLQYDMASELNRKFPKTSEEVDILLGTVRRETDQRLLTLSTDFQKELELLEAKKNQGALENPQESIQKLKDAYQEKYKELLALVEKETKHAYQAVSENVHRILDQANELSSEFQQYRKEYDQFVIETAKSLSHLNASLETHDAKTTKLLEDLVAELKHARYEHDEIKKILEEIKSSSSMHR